MKTERKWKDVLNLVISGMPSILFIYFSLRQKNYCFKPCYKWNAFNTLNSFFKRRCVKSFKPCYKWNAFNTMVENFAKSLVDRVLNLVISGMPSIRCRIWQNSRVYPIVLNLVISGMPSILSQTVCIHLTISSVLNLVISGMPSILRFIERNGEIKMEF